MKTIIKISVLKKVMIIILTTLIVFALIIIIGNLISINASKSYINEIEAVSYDNQLIPQSNGTEFVVDREFKILQLSDIHIGGGFLTIAKDKMAINAVEAIVKEQKPDLVVVTGDITYAVPFQAGTFNNKLSAKLFAQLMERLGVYWCLTFGNHDTEAYSYYNRNAISRLYEDEKYSYCLYTSGDEKVDGNGNYSIKIKNTKGEIVQALIMLDSHSYTGNALSALTYDYDTIHSNQVEWYEKELNKLKAENNGIMPKSLAFFHIPLPEYQQAWYEYKDNGFKDTDNVKYVYGRAGEVGKIVYPCSENYGFFDKALELGSTKGMFCGHDHMNNFAVEYKGIQLSYSYTIDYLAYIGVKNYGAQRGATIIAAYPDGKFTSRLSNYYQEDYASRTKKEQVTMSDYYYEELNEEGLYHNAKF